MRYTNPRLYFFTLTYMISSRQLFRSALTPFANESLFHALCDAAYSLTYSVTISDRNGTQLASD